MDELVAPEVRTAAEGYVSALTSALALQRTQNPTRFRALREAADQAAALAGALAGAAARLLPDRVGGSAVPDPDASPVGLRAVLVEHSHLLALLTATAADPRLGPGTRPFASAALAVQDNADELARILGDALGRDPAALSEAWMEHVRSLAQYAVASRLSIEAGAVDARRELEAFPGHWGRGSPAQYGELARAVGAIERAASALSAALPA